MTTPQAPFGETFDAIDLSGARTDRAALERAMALAAPSKQEEPGFYLLDDASGRFVVDRAFGTVSLANEAILETERNRVHAVRLRVIEPSGACYEIEMRLRLTGRVPKMVGAEDIDFLAGAPALDAPAPSPRTIHWSAYAAASGAGAAQAINDEARFGAVFAQPLPPAAPGPYRLHLFTPLPLPSEKSAIWSL